MPKCPDTEHNYQKFDDATVVCTKCADQRVVDLAALIGKLPQPIYLPCPGPHYPQYVPWWQPTWISPTSPTITFATSTSTPPIPDSVTIYSGSVS